MLSKLSTLIQNGLKDLSQLSLTPFLSSLESKVIRPRFAGKENWDLINDQREQYETLEEVDAQISWLLFLSAHTHIIILMNYRFLAETLALPILYFWIHQWHHHQCANGCSRVCPFSSHHKYSVVIFCHIPQTISNMAPPFEVCFALAALKNSQHLARVIRVSEIMENSKRGENIC